MTPAFDDLPVALPPGCAGARVAGDPSGWAEAFDWPTELTDAAATRRSDFLMGRLAAVEALRRLGAQGSVGRSPEGAPVWPEGIAGSLTHHSGVAAAIVGRQAGGQGYTGLGIDICPRLEGDRLRAVVRQCLTEAEREAWASEDAATLAFAAKESIYKAAYPRAQRFIGFDEAEIVDVGDAGRSTVEKHHPVDAFDRRTHAGTWTAVLADELARLLGVDTVTGSYAWDGELVYAVLALESSR
jgi:4'-phosphopantetheinyl transferase EntD